MSELSPADSDLLSNLFSATVAALTAKIKGGKASAGDLKNAIQLLKDNGVTCEVKKANPFDRLKEDLPFKSADQQ
jgi:hypothetical protein